jgi:hypothetical protein
MCILRWYADAAVDAGGVPLQGLATSTASLAGRRDSATIGLESRSWDRCRYQSVCGTDDSDRDLAGVGVWS